MALSCRTPVFSGSRPSVSRTSAPLRRPFASGPASRTAGGGAFTTVRVQRPGENARSHQLPVCQVLNVDVASFDAEILQSKQPVLVDFWASWCGPCKLIGPLMVWAEKEYGSSLKVVKVEVDANKPIVEQYKVYGLPTFIIFRNGAEVEGSKREGAMNKNSLTQYLNSHGIVAPAKVEATSEAA